MANEHPAAAPSIEPISITSADILDEIVGHLGAAKMQLLPTDDARIAEHIRAAYDYARLLRRAL